MSPKLLLTLPAVAMVAGGCGAAVASTVAPHAHHHRRPSSGEHTTVTFTSTTTETTSSTAAAAPARCTVAQLRVRQTASNGAAGSIGLTYALTNVSATTCSLFGYPGMQMLAAGGRSLPTTVIRRPSVVVPSVPERTVVLSPNAIASFYAGYSDVSAASCPQAARLEVTPPNAYDHLTVGTSIAPCRGQINVSPVFVGGPAM